MCYTPRTLITIVTGLKTLKQRPIVSYSKIRPAQKEIEDCRQVEAQIIRDLRLELTSDSSDQTI